MASMKITVLCVALLAISYSALAHDVKGTSASFVEAAMSAAAAVHEASMRAALIASETTKTNVQTTLDAQRSILNNLANIASSANTKSKQEENNAAQAIVDLVDTVNDLVSQAANAINSDTQNSLSDVINTVEVTGDKILQALQKATSNITSTIDNACDNIDSIVEFVSDSMKDNLHEATVLLRQAFDTELGAIVHAIVHQLSGINVDVARGFSTQSHIILSGDASARNSAVSAAMGFKSSSMHH